MLDVQPYQLFFSEKDSLEFIDVVRDELYLGKLKKGIDEVFEQFR